MSAYIVEKSHINALVKVALNYSQGRFSYFWHQTQELHSSNADRTGQMLLDANIHSVHYRYPNDTITNLPGRADADYLIPYQFYPFGRKITAVQALKLLNSYEYQACEDMSEWSQSEAKAFCDALKDTIIMHLPGYEEAAWDWQDEMPVNKPVRLI